MCSDEVDDVGDESENESENDNNVEVESESESESDYDTTDDEFDESYCTAEIINISDHEAVDQHSELKKWLLENRVPDITDEEKETMY